MVKLVGHLTKTLSGMKSKPMLKPMPQKEKLLQKRKSDYFVENKNWF
jgi:hypothetical protein